MTKEQFDGFKNYAEQIKHNRDYYSRAYIIEHLVRYVENIDIIVPIYERKTKILEQWQIKNG